MPDAPIFIFAWLHTFFAVCWIGATVFVAFVVGPVSRRSSQQTAIEFRAKFLPHMGKVMRVIITLTVFFGALSCYSFTNGRTFGNPPGQWNLIMYTGAFLGLTAYIFGMTEIDPLTTRIGATIKEIIATLPQARSSTS
jgi:hypothetical protein